MVNGLCCYNVQNFLFSILILRVQITSMSFKSVLWTVVGAGGSRLGFGISILIWIWSRVFDTHIFLTLALYIDFDGAKKICCL